MSDASILYSLNPTGVTTATVRASFVGPVSNDLYTYMEFDATSGAFVRISDSSTVDWYISYAHQFAYYGHDVLSDETFFYSIIAGKINATFRAIYADKLVLPFRQNEISKF